MPSLRDDYRYDSNILMELMIMIMRSPGAGPGCVYGFPKPSWELLVEETIYQIEGRHGSYLASRAGVGRIHLWVHCGEVYVFAFICIAVTSIVICTCR